MVSSTAQDFSDFKYYEGVEDLKSLNFVLQDEGHTEWVSCVRFSPNSSNPIIVSCGWDKLVKVSFYFKFEESLSSQWLACSMISTFACIIWHDRWGENYLMRAPPHSSTWWRSWSGCDDHFPLLPGVEPGQLQAEDQPHRPHWLPEHGDCVSWWFSVRIGWKGNLHGLPQNIFLLRHKESCQGFGNDGKLNTFVFTEHMMTIEAVSEHYLELVDISDHHRKCCDVVITPS